MRAVPPSSDVAQHVVTVYDRDDDLTAAVAQHVAEGLDAGERVVVLATPAHRAAVRALLKQQGTDGRRAVDSGRYLDVDAAEALSAFVTGGRIDEARFEDTIGGLLDRAAAGGHAVRVFGEMVALLWADGDAALAVELEGQWNRLAQQREFSLLCGYPTAALEAHPELTEVDGVCRAHSLVQPPDSYMAGVAAQRRPEADVSRVFVAVPSAVRAARHWVRVVLADAGHDAIDDRLVDDVAMVASELATNAVRHAVSAFRATIVRADAGLRLVVEDLSAAGPTVRAADDDRLGGRGVAIVAQLSQAWGHTRTASGKVVWAEFAVPAA